MMLSKIKVSTKNTLQGFFASDSISTENPINNLLMMPMMLISYCCK